MPGKFVITKTPKGFFRFNLQAANYQTVLTSQNYASLRNCKDGIEAIKKNALSAVEDQTVQNVEKKKFPKYEVYLDKRQPVPFPPARLERAEHSHCRGRVCDQAGVSQRHRCNRPCSPGRDDRRDGLAGLMGIQPETD